MSAVVGYAFSVMMTKISILLYYHRIFKIRWVLLTSITIGLFVIAYSIALILVAAFECIPLSALWTFRGGQCIDTVSPYTTFASVPFCKKHLLEHQC